MSLSESAAFLGFVPSEALARFTPAELVELLDGDRRRFNRIARVVAWAVGLLPMLVAQGVAQGIAIAFRKDDSTPPRVEPISWLRLVRSVPHFRPEAIDRAAERAEAEEEWAEIPEAWRQTMDRASLPERLRDVADRAEDES